MSNIPEFESVVMGTLNSMVKKKELDHETMSRRHVELTQGVFVNYFTQENFTVCTLQNNDATILSIGVSKRNNGDEFNSLRGRALALTRAIREFVKNAE